MEIIYDEYPPNYGAIAKVFDIKDKKNIVFTYGHKLYVPGGRGINLDKPLLEHENTHALQQTEMGIEKWWTKYLKDSEFRFIQELEAYRNQYRSMGSLSLRQRAGYLNHIVKDLSGAMYGNVVTPDEARKVITDGINFRGRSVASKTSPSARKLKKRERQNRKKGRK